MARQRSPERSKAFEIWKNSGGTKKLKDIAAELGVMDTQIRKWKNHDKWEQRIKGTLLKDKGNVTKKDSYQKRSKEVPKIDENQNSELTEKQKLFAEIYVRNFNATQAAIKAGYSPNSAFVEGCRLLKHAKVRAYVEYLKNLKKESIMLDVDDIVERYMRIAFADMTDFIEFGQEEVPIITREGVFMMPNPETGKEEPFMQKVNVLKFKDSDQVDGGLIREIKTSRQGTSLKLEDRQKALDWLSNFFEMNPEHKHKRAHDERKLQLERERFEHTKEMDKLKAW